MVAVTGVPQDLKSIPQEIPSSLGPDGLTVSVWNKTTAAAQAPPHGMDRNIVDAFEGASQQHNVGNADLETEMKLQAANAAL